MAYSYGKIVESSLRFAGVDQGVDFTGPGDIYAPYGAVVTRVQAGGSGWPGQGAVVNIRLLEGPAAGHHIYYAEDLAPLVKVGQRVAAGQTIARATGSGQAPGIEIGWAQASGIPLAPRPPARPAPQWTKEGANFFSFITGSGLVPTGGTGSDTPNANTEAGKTAAGVATQVPGVQQVLDAGKLLGRLTDPSYILRGLQIIAGGGMVAVGVVLLARQVALAADLPDPAGMVGIGKLAKSASAASAAQID